MNELELPLLRASLARSPVVRFGDYDYFVHPLTDGIDAVEPALLAEVVAAARSLARLDVDRIVTVEAMGIPFATALSQATGVPVNVIRKRRYGLPGEWSVDQSTGYSKGALYVNGLRRGMRVVLVDDVISTGGTLAPVLVGLKAHGVEVADVLVIFEKGGGRAEVERETGVRVKTLLRVEVRDGKLREVSAAR